MLRNTLQKHAAEARAELDRRFRENDALQKQLVLAAQSAAANKKVDYLSDEEVHTLWSDGTDDGTFTNTHECWNLLKTTG